MGLESPDVAYGHGRLRVNAERLGWACDKDTVELPAPCTTTCGTVGKRWCNATCGWNKCSPPWEVCNGVDDDCDGYTDEEPQCQSPVVEAGPTDAGHGLDEPDVRVDAGASPKPAPLQDDSCQASPRSAHDRASWPLLLLAIGALVGLRVRRPRRRA